MVDLEPVLGIRHTGGGARAPHALIHTKEQLMLGKWEET